MNPNRICRMCKMVADDRPQGFLQLKVCELTALLPKAVEIKTRLTGYDNYDSAAINAALPALRNAAGDCPACIMAALRQAGLPVPAATDFNFTEECAELWDNINQQGDRDE